MKPSYILNLPLKTEKWQEDILYKRLEIARKMYNACLGELLKRHKRMKQDKEYRSWIKQGKSKERSQVLKGLNKKYGLNEYAVHAFVKPMQHHFKKNIDSFTAQKIATRSWFTFEKFLYGPAKKVMFKREDGLTSVEGKSNKSGIRFIDNIFVWNGLKIHIITKANDVYAHLALEDRVKYCRVVRRKDRYFVQLVLEGVPPKKVDRSGKDKHRRKEGKVGIDIGTQTIAVVSEEEAKLLELAPSANNIEQEKRILLRKLDRQRRATNPHKYNKDGTVKRSKEKWHHSINYVKTKKELADMQRKIGDIRKQDHNKMANWILSLGDDIKVETMNYKGLQARTKETKINERTGRMTKKKRFGKSLANKAPSMLLTILENKLTYDEKALKKIDTYKVKASQYNHFEGTFTKKTLSERWNDFEGGTIQRDLYSAFLIMNVKHNLKEIDRDSCIKKWEGFKASHDREIERLRTSRRTIASMGV
ncbi:RNA-guided endonuclease TnpB family protein [Salipaludibacillus sp. HK11]|uniref:RNA-guided endonuclease TnpB family protein n=1 Tax=Salipaludibacillus sp. HK11 TaxID=3394320 RepID=UPI0039FCDE1C